ncbi:unnamed protein product [Meganyctiphanes norvegica]|uniref:HTH psq-type domain-containing protein n=1 Tax=Meganyctiphanes norvegica TaxID=48144 RepID=A0AAV2PU59_MEGNR
MERTEKDKVKRMANEDCIPALPKKKMRNNNITPALKQQVIDLKDQGHTGKQISEQFNLANTAVSKMCSSKGRKYTEAALMTTSELKQKKISNFFTSDHTRETPHHTDDLDCDFEGFHKNYSHTISKPSMSGEITNLDYSSYGCSMDSLMTTSELKQ